MKPNPSPRQEAAIPTRDAGPSNEGIAAVPGCCLQGHSGATLMRYDRGRTSFVRKTAASPDRNERLHRQSALQRQLSGYGIPFPRVLMEGFDENGLAFFDMEYVAAANLASLVREPEYFDWQALLSVLERVVRFFQLTRGEPLPADLFHEKIDAIVKQCETIAVCTAYRPEISSLASRLGSLSWSGVPASLSHGDMTLENMLVVRGRDLVFVDCDDCFASSYWLDAAKIFQDIEGRWCLRDLHLSDDGRTAAADASRRLDRLIPAARAMLALVDAELAIRLPQFTALNLLRTLPYATEGRLVGFVLDRMLQVLDRAGL